MTNLCSYSIKGVHFTTLDFEDCFSVAVIMALWPKINWVKKSFISAYTFRSQPITERRQGWKQATLLLRPSLPLTSELAPNRGHEEELCLLTLSPPSFPPCLLSPLLSLPLRFISNQLLVSSGPPTSPWNGTAHSGLGSSASIRNQSGLSETCSQNNLGNPSIESPTLSCQADN